MKLENEKPSVSFDEIRREMDRSDQSIWMPDILSEWQSPSVIDVCLVCYTPAPFNIDGKQIKSEYCPMCGRKMKNSDNGNFI